MAVERGKEQQEGKKEREVWEEWGRGEGNEEAEREEVGKAARQIGCLVRRQK